VAIRITDPDPRPDTDPDTGIATQVRRALAEVWTVLVLRVF